MQPQPCSRIDLAELKAQLVKRIGAERSKRYFFYLNKLLSQKLSKTEFNKFCCRELGCENIPLHNQILRSILKNACHAKTPPPAHASGSLKLGVQGAKSSPGREDGHDQASAVFSNQNPNVPIWSNGVLPLSPRKGKSGIRERKLKDRPSPLGPNGNVPSMGLEVGVENGDATRCDYQRPILHPHSAAEIPDTKREVGVGRLTSLTSSRSPLLAPLGIPFCPASVGGARKAAPVTSTGGIESCYDSGELYDSDTLRKRMEQIAAAQGLTGVSVECANTMNVMLDVYLKRLIQSCVDLVGARSTPELKKQATQKQQIQGKVINGIWPSNHMHVYNGTGNPSMEATQQAQRSQSSISLHDFKVAMELNPQQLGDDWPLLLEKITMHQFEE